MATCSLCPQASVSAHLVRVGQIPTGWTFDKNPAAKDNDRSHLRVIRVCADHRAQVPR